MKVVALVLLAVFSTANAVSTPNYYCGFDGWHTGTYLQQLPSSASPNGIEWQHYECAQRCKEYEECEFWTLRMNRGKECLLMKNKGTYVEEKRNPHMEGDEDGNCLIDPPYKCGDDYWHHGSYVETLEPVDGVFWKWYECADKCLENPDCEFWTLRMDRGRECILQNSKGPAVKEEEHPHREGDKFGRCLRDASYSCGFDGWHEGTRLGVFPPPDGRDWREDECEKKCQNHNECEFWTLRMNRGKECLLMKDQGRYVEEKHNPHKEGDKYGKCLTDPPYTCGYDVWHQGRYLKTLSSKDSPNGREWQGVECAAACKEHGECEFWTLRLNRGGECLFLKDKGQAVVEKQNPHMEGDGDGNCINQSTARMASFSEDPNVCMANAWGDPHLVTFDGLKYDAMSHGDHVFLESVTSALAVHGRFEGAFDVEKFDPAVTTGIAVRGEDSNHPIIKLLIPSVEDYTGYKCEETKQETEASYTCIRNCPVELYVDDVEEDYDDSFDKLAHGGVAVVYDNSTDLIAIEYPGLLYLEVELHFWHKCHFWVDFHLLNCSAAETTVIGLLGSPNGNAADDWMNQDGSVKEMPVSNGDKFFEPAFTHSQAWKVTESDSLFNDMKEFPDETYDSSYEEAITNGNDEINELCGDNWACRVEGINLGINAAAESLENPAEQRTLLINNGAPRTIIIADEDLLCPEEI